MRVMAVASCDEEALMVSSVVEELRSRDIPTLFLYLGAEAGTPEWSRILGVQPDEVSVLDATTPTACVADALSRVACVVEDFKPDWVVLHSGSEGSFGAAVASYCWGCRILHLGSGMRFGLSRDASVRQRCRRGGEALATLLHVATERAAQSLKPHTDRRVVKTGSTLTGTLLSLKNRLNDDSFGEIRDRLGLQKSRPCFVVYLQNLSEQDSRRVVSAAYRVERLYPDIRVVVVTEKEPCRRLAEHANRRGVEMMSGFGALEVAVVGGGNVVASDVGWFQEAAAVFGFGFILLSDATDRPEALDSGWAVLAGCKTDKVAKTAVLMLKRWKSPTGRAVFGDENSAKRLVDAMLQG